MILSICIPTYNRSEELLYIVKDKLFPLLEQSAMKGNFEFVVSDNSTGEHLEVNQKNFSDCEYVQYFANGKNIGFSGNVINCVKKSRGKFFWIMPDNDDIHDSSFIELMNLLVSKQDEIDCILVPFDYKNLLSEHVVGGRYSVKDNTSIFKFMANGDLPFILLSSGIIKKNISVETIDSIHKEFADNAFIQIPLIINNFDKTSKVKQFIKPVIKYKVEYDGRFNPANCYESIVSVLLYLEKNFLLTFAGRKKAEYRSLLLSIISESTGIYNIYEVEEAKAFSRKKLMKNFGVKELLLYFVTFLPKNIQSKIYKEYMILISIKSQYHKAKKSLNERC